MRISTPRQSPGSVARFYIWSKEPLGAVSVQIGLPEPEPPFPNPRISSVDERENRALGIPVGHPAGSPPKEYVVTMQASAGARSWLHAGAVHRDNARVHHRADPPERGAHDAGHDAGSTQERRGERLCRGARNGSCRRALSDGTVHRSTAGSAQDCRIWGPTGIRLL